MPPPFIASQSAGGEAHRVRPGLGTFVEVRVTAPNQARAARAIDGAFRAVARVHACMSPREPDSDVSRLNQAEPGAVLAVDPWTWRVLAAAHKLSQHSGGVFDATASRASTGRGNWNRIELLDGSCVRLRDRVRIDLGGIAKGFAVDRSVAALRAQGAVAGVVNAGGDLRVFGRTGQAVLIRLPGSPCFGLAGPTLQEEAFATSSNAADPRGAGRLVRPDGGRLWIGRGSVSVRAPTCLAADALCKIVAAIGPRAAAPLLRRHRAQAFVITARTPIPRAEVPHAA